MKKGISLVILIITVVVLLIITSVVVSKGISMRSDVEYIRFEKEFEIVEKAVKKAKLKGQTFGTLIDQSVAETYRESIEKIYDDYEINLVNNNYYVLTQVDFKDLGISNISDVFFVNYETNSIFSARSILYEDSYINTTQDTDVFLEEYNSDGLLLRYDGKNNLGTGEINHSSTTTIWKDVSGNGLDGTINNISGTTTSGWKQDALVLDGIDDGVFLSNNVRTLLNNNFTVEIVCKSYNVMDRAILIGNYGTASVSNPTGFEITATGKYRAYWREGLVDKTVNSFQFVTNEKVSVSFVIDSVNGQLKAYKNGQLIETYSDSNLQLNNQLWTNVWIGRDGRTLSVTNDNICFEGEIYSVRIYNRALTNQEIQSNYTIDNSRFNMSQNDGEFPIYIDESLMVYYDGINNLGTGDANHSSTTTTWKDASGSKLDGIINNTSGTATSGWKENALVLDGIDDGIFLSNKIRTLVNSNFTVEIVCKSYNVMNRAILIGNYGTASVVNPTGFEITATGKYRAYWRKGAVNAIIEDYPFVTNEKIGVTFVVDSVNGQIKLYKNGQSVTTYSNNKLKLKDHSWTNVWIGRDGRTTSGTENICFEGEIYAVRIYSRALTDQEIQSNYLVDSSRFGI